MLEMRESELSIMLCGVISSVRFQECTVVQYGYRRGILIHSLIKTSRCRELEDLLAKAAGKEIDNFTVYEITYGDGKSIAVSCEDHKMRFGLGVKEGCWW